MLYFDWNATAPLHAEAQQVWLEASGLFWANPSTPYKHGRKAHLALEKGRSELASLMKVAPEQVVFTSGATETNNARIRQAARVAEGNGEMWMSAIEHPSIHGAARHYFDPGKIRIIPVNRNGEVELDWIEAELKGRRPSLIAVMAANNETGVLQPIREIGRLSREAGVPFHCDAVQYVGKAGLEELAEGGSLAISGHKLGGPKGVGALILEAPHSGMLLQAGGAQEFGFRGGTEDIPSILAMVQAFKIRLKKPVPKRPKCSFEEAVKPVTTEQFEAVKPVTTEQFEAREAFERGLVEALGDEVMIHGKGALRLWNTSSLALPGAAASRWILQLDRRGISVSSGSACSAGKEGPSSVLQAMGVDARRMERSLRISSGWETAVQDWEMLLFALLEIREQFKKEAVGTGNTGAVGTGNSTVIDLEN